MKHYSEKIFLVLINEILINKVLIDEIQLFADLLDNSLTEIFKQKRQ